MAKATSPRISSRYLILIMVAAAFIFACHNEHLLGAVLLRSVNITDLILTGESPAVARYSDAELSSKVLKFKPQDMKPTETSDPKSPHSAQKNKTRTHQAGFKNLKHKQKGNKSYDPNVLPRNCEKLGNRSGSQRHVYFRYCNGSWVDKDLSYPGKGSASELCGPGWHACGINGVDEIRKHISPEACHGINGKYVAAHPHAVASKLRGCNNVGKGGLPAAEWATHTCETGLEPMCCGTKCSLQKPSCANHVFGGSMTSCQCTHPCGDFPSTDADGILCCPGKVIDTNGLFADNSEIVAEDNRSKEEIVDLVGTTGMTQPHPCMLVPVYPPHFGVLNARIMMTHRTNIGPVVKTVAVFGDRNEHKIFCRKFPRACGADKGFHGISLESILGRKKFKRLKRILGFEGQSPQVHSGDRKGCWSKSEGRVFQTVKKFYGAGWGPAECGVYWVSDAESLPFRKHNMYNLMKTNMERPSIVLGEWRNDSRCRNIINDEGKDMSCAIFMSSLANGFRWKNDTARTIFTGHRYKHGWWFVDQWWIYHPQTTRLWLSFLENATQKEGWYLLAWLRMSDNAIYGMMMEWAADYAMPDQVTIRNIRTVIKERHPRAFNKCCQCSGGDHPPCLTTPELLGANSCLSRRIPVLQRVHLLVEELGIFGLGNYLRFGGMNDEGLNAQDTGGRGVHWCYNNCFQPGMYARLLNAKGADKVGLGRYSKLFSSTHV